MIARGGLGGEVGRLGAVARFFRDRGRAIFTGLLLLAALLIPSCATSPVVDGPWVVEPSVDGARRFVPTAAFAAAWWEMEECSGRRGDLRDVAWFIVDTGGEGHFPCTKGRCLGSYRIREHAVYLADHFVADVRVVRHEILHALGVLGHPFPVFPICAPRRM